ncbi:MAG TPA: DUF47 family protein [Nitrososphaeraceae archaeon]|nr:DUF47 family protein [Nitrososphaeraceae archaeon]
MYSGELEGQAKRKALAVLNDEISRILGSARDLAALTNSLLNGDDYSDIQTFMDRMRNAEEEIENIRRNITREVSAIGSIMIYREDILRTAYLIDDIAGYISWVAFRLTNINMAALKKGGFDEEVKQLIGLVVDAILKVNDMARALSINPTRTIELTNVVQKLERQIDSRYRFVMVKALSEISLNRDLFVLKNAIEGIEGMADKCQEASGSITILALST